MAVTLFGSGVVRITGKVQGTVYQGGPGLPIARRKISPRNPGSPGQQATRGAVEFCGRSWKDVSEICKEEWRLLAVPPRDGFHQFMSYNIPRVRIGLPIVLCPGVITNLFEQPFFAQEFE